MTAPVGHDQRMEDLVRELEQFGSLTVDQFKIKKGIGPEAWDELGTPLATMLSGAQWAMAAWVKAGRELYAGVEAIDPAGRPCDPEAEGARPWSFEQVVHERTRRASQTIMNWNSTISRYPYSFCTRPPYAWRMFSHFAALAPRDIPDEVAHPWLADRSLPNVEDLEHVRDQWRAAQREDEEDEPEAPARPPGVEFTCYAPVTEADAFEALLSEYAGPLGVTWKRAPG